MGKFPGAVMVADITGFTALTEKLSTGTDSTVGVELLTRCMNSYFTNVIDLVALYGGDVIKFAGDAIIVAFRAPKTAGEEMDGERQRFRV